MAMLLIVVTIMKYQADNLRQTLRIQRETVRQQVYLSLSLSLYLSLSIYIYI